MTLPTSSWPGSSRPSTPPLLNPQVKTWMPAFAGMTADRSRMLALEQPVGRDLAADAFLLGVLASQRSERGELDAETHDVDEAGEGAASRRRDLAGDELAEIRQL